MSIVSSIIAKLEAPPALRRDRGRTTTRQTRADSAPKKAVIVSLREKPVTEPGYAAQMARRVRSDPKALSEQRARSEDMSRLLSKIEESHLTQAEKIRLGSLLKAAPWITNTDWPEFISRLTQLVTLREALGRAQTQITESEQADHAREGKKKKGVSSNTSGVSFSFAMANETAPVTPTRGGGNPPQ